MSEEMSIEEREDGPLVVKGVQSMWDSDQEPIDCKPVMALCRCGASETKPFCDGSHNKIGFKSNGRKPAGRDRLITYQGAEISVTYNPMLCSHAAECGRLAGDIFNPSQKPWVQPDKGSVQQVRDVVSACPSGALAIATDIGDPEHLVAMRPQIQIEKDGPYWVHDIDPPAPQLAKGASPRKYVLCRCGLSGNKPYCDGSHRDAKWSELESSAPE